MDVKDIILALSIAKGAGGSGSGVTKEYVDSQVGAVSERVDDVEDVIPSAATPQNKLATAADVSGTAIPSNSTTSPVTDSADGIVQGITIYGRSEVVDDEIKSVGDNGLTVATANSDNTLTTSAEFTTALPLRGVSDTVRNKLTCTADVKQVETVCGKVRLADLSWSNIVTGGFAVNLADSHSGIIDLICSKYPYDNSVLFSWTSFDNYDNKTLYRSTGQSIYIKDTDYATVEDFVASLGDAELVYELAEPITTPLTDAEISAFRGLRTFDGTTNITITDNPDFEFDYLKNSDNGQAVADIQRDLQEQVDGLKIKTLAYTGTGTSTNTITFPEIPVCIFSFVNKQRDSYGNFNWTNPFTWNSPYITIYYTGSSSGSQSSAVSYTGNTLTLTGSDAGLAMNRSDTEYNIYYI